MAQESDEEFVKQTAGEMGVPTEQQRPDLWVLNWFGLRPRVESAGITFAGTWTLDESKNFQGGVATNNEAFRQLLDLRVNVDTHALFNWQGGTFSIDFQNQAGRNGSDVLTGDVQGFDNADSDGRTQISELWYQQTLFDQRLRIKIGKVDANSEFAFPEYGAAFVNSSFGHSPTLFLMPTYPDPSMSANIFVYPTRFLYGGFGIYDGSGAGGVATGNYGPKNFFTGDGGYFMIGEAGVRWVMADDTLPGRLALGGWGSTSRLTKFDGTTTSGTAAFYAMLEQTLWHKKYYDKTSAEGIAAFLQYGHADPHLSDVEDYVGIGLTDTGPFDVRRDDIVGIGAAYAHVGEDPAAGFTRDFEMSIEGFYSLQITPYLAVKPDLQYIIHSGGTTSDALVATVRVTLAF